MRTWTGCSARGTWTPTPPSEPVRVLVTGGGGFAGLHLLRELTLRGGLQLTATYIGRAPTARECGPELAGVEWVLADLTDARSLQDVIEQVQPRQVYHLAGQASVGASFADPLATWEVNATGTVRLMEALGSRGDYPVRVLLISSAEVYGAVPLREQPIGEDQLYRPITPYGGSKAAAEIAALQAGRARGIEVVVARSFNHIGPGQDERFVMASMAKQLAALRALPVEERILRVGNLEVERDFLDVRDVARAYRFLMDEGAPGAAYNVCSGRAVSLRDIVERLVELSGSGARVEVEAARVRPADIPSLAGDNTRLRALGWEPRHGLDDTLRDLLAAAGAAAPAEGQGESPADGSGAG